GGAEVSVREAPGTGIGGTREHGLGRRLVERVVEPRHHSGGVAKAGVGRDIRDALAVDPDLAPVAQALQELRPGEWTLGYRRGIEGHGGPSVANGVGVIASTLLAGALAPGLNDGTGRVSTLECRGDSETRPRTSRGA